MSIQYTCMGQSGREEHLRYDGDKYHHKNCSRDQWRQVKPFRHQRQTINQMYTVPSVTFCYRRLEMTVLLVNLGQSVIRLCKITLYNCLFSVSWFFSTWCRGRPKIFFVKTFYQRIFSVGRNLTIFYEKKLQFSPYFFG